MKISLMLNLQNSLNSATNGENWTDGVTKNNKIINWNRCIYMECAEMIDSFSWKHWKSIDKAPDWDNMQIEVVDVWHFILSLAIENYATCNKGTVEDLALHVESLSSYKSIVTSNSNFASQDEVILKVENIMRLTLSRESLELEKLMAEFFDLVSMSGLNLEKLYKLYVGKNILNQFRQDNGYKDGSYIKVWNSKEDNVVMMDIWQTRGELQPQELYEELNTVYKSLPKS